MICVAHWPAWTPVLVTISALLSNNASNWLFCRNVLLVGDSYAAFRTLTALRENGLCGCSIRILARPWIWNTWRMAQLRATGLAAQ